MNFKQMTLCTAVAIAIAFGAATTPALAITSSYPSVQLSLSGTLYSTTNSGNEMGVPIKLLSYNNQVLFHLLNASPTASNEIFLVTGKTNIPSGSFFVWNPDEETLSISNANHFSFPLQGSGYDFGYMEVDYYQLVGTYSINDFAWPDAAGAAMATFAGAESDSTGIYFYFNDGSVNENEIELYGTATLNWLYGPATAGSQSASLSVTLSGAGNDDCYVNGYAAIPGTFSGSGSGSGIEPTDYVPFYYEY
jgi:hypothetical protein